MSEILTKDTRPLMVSIKCLTYNHEPFIRQCLEGFVMQKTNFRFEAIVHDDASTDGTAVIIREYAEKYPDIIKPIYETENQYSKHDGSLRRIMNAHIHGKYVALCEGDDYWTDPLKLQKQVDFLESHLDYTMCSHRWDEYFENERRLSQDIPGNVPKDGLTYSLDDLVHGAWYFQPLTVMYRYSVLDLGRYELYKPSKDITLFYLLLSKGEGYCFTEAMATYRIHSGGVWCGSSQNEQRLQDMLVKTAIYNVEQSREAATYILQEFTKLISRFWMLKQSKLFWKVGIILSKHFGRMFVIKIYMNKLLRSKRFTIIKQNIYTEKMPAM